ncbi:nucleoside triphosphate pyrophosphohydrolase [bacterium]|nr:nucleoside triphosphate pyrophosphohydrolase [bacterium]
MAQKETNVGNKFEALVDIMRRLRAPDGCPWDREQTHQSLRPYLLEETYEVLESLDEEDKSALSEELGDLLLQIVFHAQIASEREDFAIEDVIDAISQKLIRRHPNVFGDVVINSAEEQSSNWEKLKKDEGKTSVLDGVPNALSALLRAWRIQQKASAGGFDWPDVGPVWKKIHEEIDELQIAVRSDQSALTEDEFGDLLFSLVNLSRFMKINPEDALRKATNKFISRFKKVETEYANQKRDMSKASIEELDTVWERVKSEEQNGKINLQTNFEINREK